MGLGGQVVRAGEIRALLSPLEISLKEHMNIEQ